ncbi:MAG TPA: Sec-independent protein translocase protein TatB [Methylobacterium sp.]|jgi:sec-independent protein translocase protein TatB|uniref:Sec-independent protein translocase protein TatB n=1 Tax=Methylorubrum sp. B1-46 TaxID=2897334 RepID=UPI001E59801B|nr:Sec-independent protein translocase protein TatB [Methylorubrum sp. B1-46]UGB24576.1 Sec-independent protein translocase protein TatB [Methylorubrum sp. B1-46]HEV2543964.1 Sec-independent protein translocase protein TatB [Methylobacterium sp.]
MLDMSWGEVMLIGGVALIVIGPKDLPKALRTLGQITTKVRRMAGEFQSQFNEAIREAELEEVRRDVEGVKRTVDAARPTFNPVDTIRNEIRSAVESRPGAGSKDAGVKDTGSFDVPRPTPEQQAAQMHGASASSAAEASPTTPGTKTETGPTP